MAGRKLLFQKLKPKNPDVDIVEQLVLILSSIRGEDIIFLNCGLNKVF